MLYIVTNPIKSKNSQHIYRPGDFLYLSYDKAKILLNERVIRSATPEEVLNFIIYNRGKYPVSWLHFGFHYAFKHEKRPEVPSHLKDLVNRLEIEVKIGLDKYCYTYVIESLELVYRLIFNPGSELFDISTQTYKDLIGGYWNLCIVLKPFNIIARAFKKNDFVSPTKKLAFQLIRQGFIRLAYPAEALEYLITHTEYPEFWFVYGGYYAFGYPAYPDLPEDIVHRVKKFYRAYEHC